MIKLMLMQKEIDDALVWEILAEKEKSHVTSTAELGGFSSMDMTKTYLFRIKQ